MYKQNMGIPAVMGIMVATIVMLVGMFWVEGLMAATTTVKMQVNGTDSGRPIPSSLFGIFFEEINHGGAGGLWAELVSNRGFEAGGQNTPSNISPWLPLGNDTQVSLATDRNSCFGRNPIALRMDVLCEPCDVGGVGVINPGYWGMDIVAGQSYRIVFWIRSMGAPTLTLSFISNNGSITLAQANVSVLAQDIGHWHKKELNMTATITDHYGAFSIATMDKTTIWLDQVSIMPIETFKGHGFRKDLAAMLVDLKPGFVRFPGGTYVEGGQLRNAWRWRETIGPWEERPGHYGDVWGYWSDDGIGFFELLQLAEDLNAMPIWVFNCGISRADEVPPSLIGPFIKDTLNALEFAKGSSSSYWGEMRASMGHVDPFDLQYVSIGNEDCGLQYYRDNYIKFYNAIKQTYPDMNIISNCDGSYKKLDHPADIYDFHVYTSANNLYNMAHQFDHTSRTGPKIFVSEYAVTGNDAGKGSLYAALAEGAFRIGLELNSDVVELASYAPLFVNTNDRRWNPDSIVFDSWQQYGTPSYWVQQLFISSNGANVLPYNLSGGSNIVASALHFKTNNGENSIIVKIVNFGSNYLSLQLQVDGIKASNATITMLASSDKMDENSFSQPNKIIPKTSAATMISENYMEALLPPYSMASINVQITQSYTDM